MKAKALRKIFAGTQSPLSLHTSDGKQLYVDNPERVLVSEDLIAIGCGCDPVFGMVREIILLCPDHIVRAEPTKRRALPIPA